MNDVTHSGFGGGTPQTMTTREIAELTGKGHRHVMRDCDVMFAALEIDPEGYAQTWTHPQNGQSYRQYALPEDLTITLVSGYDVHMRHKIVVRWRELEAAPRDPMALLNDPVAMRGLLMGYSEKVILLEQINSQLAPKADALDLIADAEGSFCLTDAAKVLQMRRVDLERDLNAREWIYRRAGTGRWHGHATKEKQRLVTHKVTSGHKVDGTEWVSEQVRITPKGIAKLATLLTEGRA